MRKRNVGSLFMGIFGYSVAVLFVVLGLYLIFTKSLDNIQPEMRTILGIILLLYGVFRSVINYQKLREARYEEDE
ncbi:MAG: hypothetical protein JXA61_08180 [Bacteroidales bacterium]|nr:hypothetical protein [Bacteroidales bacterium]